MNTPYVMFMLAMLGLLVLAVCWLKRRGRLCPGRLIIPFLVLSVLALDQGLLIFLQIIGAAGGMGGNWPPAQAAWMSWYRALPLVLALVASVLSLWALAREKFPLRLTAACGIVSLAALFQGVVRLRWVKPERLMELFTAHALDPPWTTIRASAASVLVLSAIALLLFNRARKPVEKLEPQAA